MCDMGGGKARRTDIVYSFLLVFWTEACSCTQAASHDRHCIARSWMGVTLTMDRGDSYDLRIRIFSSLDTIRSECMFMDLFLRVTTTVVLTDMRRR